MTQIDPSELMFHVAGVVVLTAMFLGMIEYVGFRSMLAIALAIICMNTRS